MTTQALPERTIAPADFARLNSPSRDGRKVLGLDLSLTATGWCTAGEWALQWGVHETKKLRGMERLATLQTAIQEQARLADLVIIEGFAFGAKGKAVYEIAGLGYLVRYWLWKKQKPFVLVTPTQLKKFVTGKGNCDKQLVLREVYRRWGHVIDDDNAADAVGLGYIGMSLAGEWNPQTAEQKAVIADLRKANGL
jgi:Holliday junction resolvasome RuvABC endonuclease subunit